MRMGLFLDMSGGGLSVTAPVLSLAVAGNVYPPELDVALDDTVEVGDTINLEWYSDYPPVTLVGSASNTIDAGEAAANAATFTGLSSISSPTQTFFRARVERGGRASSWSNVVKHGDVTAPTITSSASQSVAAISLTADEYVTWSIIGGVDAALWSVSGSTLSLSDTTGVTQSGYTVQVRATDLAGLTADQTITVTLDLTPAAFTFTDVTGATVSTEYTSNTITVTGIASGITVPVSISGGTYSRNGGAYTSAAGEAAVNDTFAVRHTSSASYSTATNTALTVSGVSDTYTTTTEAAPPPDVPIPTTDLALFVDASDLSTLWTQNDGTSAVAADSDPVGRWDDLSGYSRHMAAAANGSTRPTYKTAGGYHWVEFDGTDDLLRYLADIGMWNASGCTVAVSMRSLSNGTADALVASGRTTTINPFYVPFSTVSTGSATNANTYIRNDSASNVTAPTTSFYNSAYDGSDRVLIMVDDGSGITIYKDGVAGTRNTYTRAGNSVTLDNVSIGGRLRTSASDFFAARVYAVAIWPGRQLNSTERGEVNTYFASLYGGTL